MKNCRFQYVDWYVFFTRWGETTVLWLPILSIHAYRRSSLKGELNLFTVSHEQTVLILRLEIVELELAMPNLVNFFSRGVVRVRFCAWCHILYSWVLLACEQALWCGAGAHRTREQARVLWFSHLFLVKLLREKDFFQCLPFISGKNLLCCWSVIQTDWQ